MTKIVVAVVVVVCLIATLREFSNSRCSTPFWRGFGMAMGACHPLSSDRFGCQKTYVNPRGQDTGECE